MLSMWPAGRSVETLGGASRKPVMKVAIYR